MKKKIVIATATRAEYGLLKPLIIKLNNEEAFEIEIAVTGAHLSPEFGLTYREIEEDHIVINEKIEILLNSDTPTAISKTMGLALFGFADYFSRINPDLLIVLGDRYETLAIVLAAMNQRIPVVHLYGGDTTEGAIDEAIRHSITKLSYLHFTSNEDSYKRVIQLGEDPERVFCVGSLGIENILNEDLLTKEALEKSLNTKLDIPYALVTFHPVTLENGHSDKQLTALFKALDHFKDIKFIITKSNADSGGRIINKKIDDYVEEKENVSVYASLGMKRYLSALKYCSMVIGNSSSGLIEAPSFFVPTINIGSRQKGRLQATSVINCESNKDEIIKAIELAKTPEFKAIARLTVNPYGDGNTSDKIIEAIKEFIIDDKINLMKKFHDLEVK
ncbi:UDP-N-acetylglucosamine 2-epimerase [Acetobacterium wieringae]|uniref:UDP-N-acetylglucosamine 2-epimerase n=1 Tax=Acetobacterium wieringae TaxID=52694 RepID=UPI002B21222B|nr:UDP-N-acetylglucosamine 2-epimerase [Acetobacterium wieringae]MEA4804376.1 UDP-N-acetylglucosamine 2-epimerase [Acetobacterium wieringae]